MFVEPSVGIPRPRISMMRSDLPHPKSDIVREPVEGLVADRFDFKSLRPGPAADSGAAGGGRAVLVVESALYHRLDSAPPGALPRGDPFRRAGTGGSRATGQSVLDDGAPAASRAAAPALPRASISTIGRRAVPPRSPIWRCSVAGSTARCTRRAVRLRADSMGRSGSAAGRPPAP